MEKKYTICYFGIYKNTYTRTRNCIDGLVRNGHQVIECNSRNQSYRKYFQLTKCYRKIFRSCDMVIVGFPGHTIMPLAWLLARVTGKKIIFDAFVSLYDSMILDRKIHSPKSIKALKYWLIDWLACSLADAILLDTFEHIKYFVQTFKIKKEKFYRFPVGCDDTIVQLQQKSQRLNEFIVHFHGTYIPVQGIPHIVEAVKILEREDIIFNIIGRLSTYNEALDLAKRLQVKNINFIDYLPYDQLIKRISDADVCLGMFGNRGKTKRTGAFKIVEAMAMKKAVITADTPAMREFFADRVHILYCKIADSKDLAEKILELKNNPKLREKIAEGGYKIFLERFTPKALGKELEGVMLKV